jgi:hypothetical protein
VYAATDPAAVGVAAASGSYLDANVRPSQPSAAALDKELAAWLWQWSREAVKLPAS